MDNLQELKNTISVVESAEKNIKKWNKLQGRELAIIPTDSNYYKTFCKWKEGGPCIYNEGTETQPMYVSGGKTNDIISLMIKRWEDFVNPHQEKLTKLLVHFKTND